MAVGVVELLEIVDVEHDEWHGVSEPTRALELLVEALLEIAVVVKLGEPVGNRQHLELAVQKCILQRQRW